MQEIPTILRTPKDGCFEFYEGGWGTYLRPIDDPDANVIISKEDLTSFTLKEEIYKIPADLWQRWIQLCFHFVDKVASTVEVSVRILRNESDPSKYRFLVPEQKVTAASVRANDFNKAIDIETGEVISSYPPVGWIPVGSSHSHNTMTAFFSGVDDKYELTDPGIHIVVGSINTTTRKYNPKASVTAGGRRFIIPYTDILDATPIENVTFHEEVLGYVDYSPPVVTYHKNKSSYIKNKSSSWSQRNTTKYLPPANNEKYKDPFYYQDSFSDDSEEYLKYWTSIETKANRLLIHQVEDVIIDYLTQNQDDLEDLQEYRTLLQSYINDIDTLIQSPIEIG
jgi:hypothetical protein